MEKQKLLEEITQKYENAYRLRTTQALAATERARKFMPGGDTRTAIWFWPYPIWIDRAEGCELVDIDGNEYIDFHNCYTAMVLGHANPKVTEVVREQVAKGTTYGALVPGVIQWAELMCRRVESVDKIRFTNSGTEAVMMAIKVARGFTGKDKIIKTEGGYHGSYDLVVYPSTANGLPQSVLVDSITISYNDEEAAEKAIVENKDQLAAIIVEGMMGAAGQIPPKDGYLSFLREVTAANDVLLILDEVMTFRLDYGGFQRVAGIRPDLTTFGKLIGGGFPVGAIGGREDIMDLFAPTSASGPFSTAGERSVRHSGTFNGNPIVALAGVSTLEQLTADEIARINRLGDSLAEGIRSIFTKLNIKGQVTGWGSALNVHFSPTPVVDGKTAREANKDILHLLHLALMERGIFIVERGLLNISTPMTEREVNAALEAVDDSLSELRPYIEEIWPELVA